MIIVDDKVEVRHKRGDVREDGKIFWGYVHKKEYWLTQEKFLQYKNKEKETAQKNYIKNIACRKESFKNWYNNNKQKNNENGKRWVKLNPDKRKESYIRYYQNNKEKVSITNKRWRENNKEKSLRIHRNISALRRSRLSASQKLSANQKKIIDCFYAQAQRLENKIGIKFHVDHITPIARGGKHEPSNLQVMPATLNMQKHAREIYKWAELQQN